MSKGRKIFIIRAVSWSLFAGLLPIIFIGWRYSLFKKIDRIQLSGWGLIGVIILFFFVRILVKYIKAGISEWCMFKQVLNGILKVLMPLGILLLICIGIRSNIEYFIQALSITLLSETIAIPINPFPKWVYEKTQGKMENVMDLFVSKLKEGEK